jgi:hypothetical protein
VGHKTFGGRMVGVGRTPLPVGDWRDTAQIEAWATDVAEALPAERAKARPKVTSIRAGALALLCFFSALSALGGGGVLLRAPDGSILGMPLSVLQHAPFIDFFMPGLILFSLGVLHLVAGLLALKLTRARSLVGMAAGAGMVIWIVTEMSLLRSAHWSQLLYLAVGAATAFSAVRAAARCPLTRPPGAAA